MTTTQAELPLALTEPTYEPEMSLAQRFDAFHAANPHILAHLESLVAKWLAAGHSRCAIATMFEVLRWQHGIATQGDAFKLNNSYRAFYSRLLIERHPEWSDAFELRRQKAVAA